MHQNVVKVVGAASGVDDDGNQESASLVDRNTCRDGDDGDCSCRPNSTLTAVNSFKTQLQRTLSCDGCNDRCRNESDWLRTRKGSIAVVELVGRTFLTSRTCVGVFIVQVVEEESTNSGELGLCDGYGTIGETKAKRRHRQPGRRWSGRYGGGKMSRGRLELL